MLISILVLAITWIICTETSGDSMDWVVTSPTQCHSSAPKYPT